MIQGQVFDDTNSNLPVSISKTSTMFERMRGLLFRKKLACNEGLWIEPCNSIHTFFMNYPIDAVFMDRTGTVINICENLPAWRISGNIKAVAVIELLAGTAKLFQIEAGKRYQWVQNDA